MSTDLQKEIQRVAAQIYATGFVAAKIDHFRPRQGTLMFHLWQQRKLTERQQRAWWCFVCDLREASGKSGPIVSSYDEATGSRTPSEFKVPKAFVNHQYRRLEKLVEFLVGPERILLKDLIADEIRANGALELDLIGFHKNGYKNSDQARSAGVATISCLLDRLVAYYHL